MFTEAELKDELKAIIELADDQGRWQFYPTKQWTGTKEELHKFKAKLNALKLKGLIQIKEDFLTSHDGEGHLIIVTPEGYVVSKS